MIAVNNLERRREGRWSNLENKKNTGRLRRDWKYRTSLSQSQPNWLWKEQTFPPRKKMCVRQEYCFLSILMICCFFYRKTKEIIARFCQKKHEDDVNKKVLEIWTSCIVYIQIFESMYYRQYIHVINISDYNSYKA